MRRPSGAAHEHVVLHFDDGTVLSYVDHRRFGLMDLCEAAGLEEHELLCAMGPEPLAADFDGPALAARLKDKDTPIKAALLDQRVVAGLGNIYVCEALFYAGLSPRRRAGSVQGVRAARLAGAIKDVLEAAIEAGGSSLRDYVQASASSATFSTVSRSTTGRDSPAPAAIVTPRCGASCRATARHSIAQKRQR